jgi:hypothetical protein
MPAGLSPASFFPADLMFASGYPSGATYGALRPVC